MGGFTFVQQGSSSINPVVSTLNTVYIYGGTVRSGVSTPRVRGGSVQFNANSSGQGEATDNTVYIRGGTIEANVYGGWLESSSSLLNVLLEAAGNTVYIEGGIISGGAINPGIYGGSVQFNADDGQGRATENTVYLRGGAISSPHAGLNTNVYGGRVHVGGASSISISNVEATNNTVNIEGGKISHGAAIDLELGTSNIYGGFVSNGTGAGNAIHGMHSITDNTLNVRSDYLPLATGLPVRTVRNFDFMNFYLPDNIIPGDIMLTSSVNPASPAGPAFRSRVFYFTKVDLKLLSGSLANIFTEGDKI